MMSGTKPGRTQSIDNEGMKMQTAAEMLQQAKVANARGDYDAAEAFMQRAAAIKAGPAALEKLELLAEAKMEIPGFLVRERTAQQQHERIDKALRRASKALTMEDFDGVTSKLADELHSGNYAQTSYDKAQAFARYMKGTPAERLGPIVSTAVLSPYQLLEAVKEGWSANELKAVQNESMAGQGGFLTAETTREDILGRATTLSVVRARATIDTPGVGGSLGFPVWQGAGDIYSTALRGVWSGETQAGTPEVATLGKISPAVKLWRLKLALSKSLLEDSGPRLVSQLSIRIGEAAAVEEDRQELVGNGADGPQGVLALQAPGVLMNKDVRVVNSGGAATITADGVINTIYALPAQYRSAPGFTTTANAATTKQLRLLKDGSGRYLFNEDLHTLCGYPYTESESMPSIAADAYPLLAGDFSGYYIADRLGLSVQLYQDSEFANLDQVVLYVRRRIGGVPGEGYRFAALKIAV
jgi:HK97 family phage major capsid protein